MMKGVEEQNVSMKIHGNARKNSRSRDMLSTLEGWVTNIKESIGGVKETLKVIEGCTNELDSLKEQLRIMWQRLSVLIEM
ncbi:hypothetical protein J1N35_000040 [Gossypium stocksii]|uniref:Uncharacterized protein n=1 Tax=Gossypium stocksii TaxID=47602 RepID=A0A9D3WGC0_9ROSI|nr:hypothetical protein J1N35_000040 [Gossypium stocksii]